MSGGIYGDARLQAGHAHREDMMAAAGGFVFAENRAQQAASLSLQDVMKRLDALVGRGNDIAAHLSVSADRLDGEQAVGTQPAPDRLIQCLPEAFDRKLDELTDALNRIEGSAYRIGGRL